MAHWLGVDIKNGSAQMARSPEEKFFSELELQTGCLVEDCQNPPLDGFRVALCLHHASWVLADLRGLSQGTRWVLNPPKPPDPKTSVVYYVRFEKHIKIGTTYDLVNRLRSYSVHPDSLLAAEPGDTALERVRHHAFTEERFGRTELFEPSERLLEHISHVVSVIGDPKQFLRLS